MFKRIAILIVTLLLACPAYAVSIKKGDCDGDSRVKRQKGCNSAVSGNDYTADSDAIGCWLLFSDGTETGAEADLCSAGGTDNMVYTGTFALGASTPTGTASGQNSVELSGVSERFALADQDEFEAASFTIGCWVLFDDSDGAYIVMTKNDVENYEIIRGGAENMVYEVTNLAEAGATDVSDATWTHLGLRYSSTTDQVEPFYNGLANCTGGCRAQTTAPTGNTDPLVLGADVNGTSSEVTGDLMECFYFDRALTNTEIAEVFLCGMDGTADGSARDTAFSGAQCSALPAGSCCS